MLRYRSLKLYIVTLLTFSQESLDIFEPNLALSKMTYQALFQGEIIQIKKKRKDCCHTLISIFKNLIFNNHFSRKS